jgi:steroid 5-alpha reductase family enzyme
MIWVLVTAATEAMAVIGLVGVAATKRTHPAFLAGFNTMILVTAIYVLSAPPLDLRKLLISGLAALYVVRMNWVLLAWQKQTAASKLDRRLSAGGTFVLPVLLANVVGWVYCLPFYFGARRAGPLSWLDLLALGTYVVGTIFHFGADYQKRRFKTRRDSKGKLLDSGFWAMCRHPNYFGDFLIYVSFALIGGNVWGWIAPLVNYLQYQFDAIPKSEKWSAETYGQAWLDYEQRTPRFLPR